MLKFIAKTSSSIGNHERNLKMQTEIVSLHCSFPKIFNFNTNTLEQYGVNESKILFSCTFLLNPPSNTGYIKNKPCCFYI